jgi:hypothetical protein
MPAALKKNKSMHACQAHRPYSLLLIVLLQSYTGGQLLLATANA